ncbi:MAG TPA: tRNA glutamyl-Q(34) synthetase GluQRS, partial [Alcanivorax sp.]|nr:tRNA glutamyl-Q(34) synthetase GluQRS [Alcanivorax sp.]
LDSERPGGFLFTALGYVGLTPPPTLRDAGVAEQLAWARANWTPAHQPGGRRLPPPSI